MNRLLIIVLLLILAGCKSYEFKAQNKSELAKVCLSEFPPNYEPTDKVVDTTYLPRIEYIEVDCDSIGKKEVPHVCQDKIVKETQYVNDPRQAYLIQNLEGKLELAKEREKHKDKLHKEEVNAINNRHKDDMQALRNKHKIDIQNSKEKASKATRQRNWLGGGVLLGILFFLIRIFKR